MTGLQPMQAEIRLILVPAGAEHRAVRRGLNGGGPRVVAIPAGPRAVKHFLDTWADRWLLHSGGVLLVGLGGSLCADYRVGEGVLIEQVWNGAEPERAGVYGCDRTLTAQIATQLGLKTAVGVSCDRVITTTVQKRDLCDRYGATVVDMEAAALLQAHCKIAILRVISDDAHHDLPDLSAAIGADGMLKPLPVALSFLQQPVAALRLIRGALTGLKSLETLISLLFSRD